MHARSTLSSAIATTFVATPKAPVIGRIEPKVVQDPAELRKKLEELMLAPFVSIAKLEARQGDLIDWRVVQFRLYVGEQLVKFMRKNFHGDFQETVDIMEEAITVLHASAQQHNENPDVPPYLSPMSADMCRLALVNTDLLHQEIGQEYVLRIYQGVQDMISKKQ